MFLMLLELQKESLEIYSPSSFPTELAFLHWTKGSGTRDTFQNRSQLVITAEAFSIHGITVGSQESDSCKKWAEISEGDLVLVRTQHECPGHKHLGSLLFIFPLCNGNSAFQFGPFLSLPCRDIWPRH